jgi:hypothetical protein
MDDGVDRILAEQAFNQRTIADVAFLEEVPVVTRQVFQVVRAAGVSRASRLITRTCGSASKR